jgi:hypothetical protein
MFCCIVEELCDVVLNGRMEGEVVSSSKFLGRGRSPRGPKTALHWNRSSTHCCCDEKT